MEKITEDKLRKELLGKNFKEIIRVSANRADETLAIESTCSKDITVDELMNFTESCAVVSAMYLGKTGIDLSVARSMVRKAVKNGLKKLNEEA